MSFSEKDYQEAVEWLFAQAPNYQIEGKKAYKPGLDNIRKLCAFFGNPQDKIKTVHIGGTNGKGSVSNMVASVLQESRLKVGLYNSPHLIDFTERIKINGNPATKTFVFDFIQKLQNLPEDIHPSFFEFTTIMAFEYFFQQKVDIAVIEVGLGGRLDSTNIILPLVSAITNVDLDHMNILGNTVEKIAYEKAGIIKNKVPIISGDEHPNVRNIIRQRAKEIEAPFIDASVIDTNFETDLKGHYQKKNTRVAVSVLKILQQKGFNISEDNIRNGLLHVQKNTGFIGRWYEFSEKPLIICDTAHNKAGLDLVFEQLNEMPQFKHIVLGFVNDKNIDEVIASLPENAFFYFVKPKIERGRDPKDYEDLMKKAKVPYQIFSSVQEGYLSASEHLKKDEMIFIGGSNFVVGEFLEKNLQK